MTPHEPARRIAPVDRVLEWAERSRLTEPAVALIAVGSVVLIGLVDAATAPAYSFAIFYLVPVCLVALLASTRAALGVCAVITLVWAGAEELLFDHGDVLAAIWNGMGRFTIMAGIALLIAALRERGRRLAEAERTTRDFLAAAAHQLRTPLTGMVATAEAVTAERDPERRVRLTENLVTATVRLRRLITSLLDLSRVDSGSVDQPCDLDLVPLARHELELASMAAPHLDVRWRAPDSVQVSANPNAVRDALANVLDNAARHARDRIELVVSSDGPVATVEVLDDGDGIPPGAESLVFERFVSLDQQGGSGLGLAIARDGMRRCGGDVVPVPHGFALRVPLAD